MRKLVESTLVSLDGVIEAPRRVGHLRRRGQAQGGCGDRSALGITRCPVAGPTRPDGGYGGVMMPESGSEELALRRKFMLIFRGGAVTRHDLSPSELQAHVEKWYRSVPIG